MGVALQCLVTKRRNFTHASRYDFPMSIKSSTASESQPNLRSMTCNTSDYSINTMETGSTHVDKTSQEARIIKRLSTLSTDPSNPPNSPNTIHRSIAFMEEEAGDEMSVVSRPYSEMEPPIPRVPNPSMNFDAISDNISSVSQHRFPGVYLPNGFHGNHHHHDHPPPPYQTLDYIDEDAITQYSMPHLLPQPHLVPHPPQPNHQTHFPLARLNLDNISENTCTTVSMTTFNEPCTDYMSHMGEEDGRGDDYHDCPPPPSPVTEYSLH